MRRTSIALLLGTLLLCGCGQSNARREVRTVTDRFYTAVQGGDGATACAQLSQDTVKELEQQEKKACDSAVGALGLAPARVAAIEVYLTNAKVDLSNGASAYLDWTSAGWRISALGCRPTQGNPQQQPMGCAVQS
jgi:hypothetical protein